MSTNKTTRSIGDNLIKTGPAKGLDHETVLLGAEKIVVGVATDEKEIWYNPETGLNEERNVIEGQTIYSLPDQAHSKWFVIDLETGDSWNPDDDTELVQLKELIKTVPEGSKQWKYYKEQMAEIYAAHPAFIRKKD